MGIATFDPSLPSFRDGTSGRRPTSVSSLKGGNKVEAFPLKLVPLFAPNRGGVSSNKSPLTNVILRSPKAKTSSGSRGSLDNEFSHLYRDGFEYCFRNFEIDGAMIVLYCLKSGWFHM